MAMWKCEAGHKWKQSDGDICPDCPKLTCDVCSHVWYTRQSNMCPNCPKWVCAECRYRWYKRDGDRCPKCLPKWTCAECNHKWYKKDGDECPKCPIHLPLQVFKEKFDEVTEKNDAIQYFESEVAENISMLFKNGINDGKKVKKNLQVDEKDEKDEISYDDHLRLGIICHSVEEYRTCQYHLRKALKIKPDFNDAMTTFEEYGYVEFKQSESGYFDNDIELIIKNGTNNIKIIDGDDEKKEEQKYDDEYFKENLPYHRRHNCKVKKFEESKIDRKKQWISCGDSYNENYKMELNFAARACGEPDLQRYIDRFVYFRVVDVKQINETILRAIMDINDDEHIKKIFERLQNNDVRHNTNTIDDTYTDKENKTDEIGEEMQKYNDNKYEIDNRLHQIQQLILILQGEVSKITGRDKKLENEKEINDFISHMKTEEKSIEQLLVAIKNNKIFEKLGGLRSFIELIKDIQSITLINEDDNFFTLLKKSWGKIRKVYSQSYLYHIDNETKMYLKVVLQSFACLNYVTDEQLEEYVKSLNEAKDRGFELETESYLELIEKQAKLRNEIKSKKSSFLSMLGKFASILENQYHRDRLSVENEMKDVQFNNIKAEITSWSVKHEKRKQQLQNVENRMKQRIDVWNKFIEPNISAKMNEIIQKQRIENKEFLNKIKYHIHDIFPVDENNKLKEKFMDIFFISLLMENSKN